ncbi:MAG TPA: hypothetical protein VIK62_05475 [Verrucomicrobiae bacterium]
MPARTESSLARNAKVSAQVELSSHGRENRRTERILPARRGKLPAQVNFEGAGSDFCAHEGKLARTESSIVRTDGIIAAQAGQWSHEANFRRPNRLHAIRC